METLEMMLMMRGIERLLIVSGGIASLVMGTLLYRWGVTGSTDASAKGGGYSFRLVNAAPGALLGIFGVIVLVVAMRSPIQIDSQLWSGYQQQLDQQTLVVAATSTDAKPDEASSADGDGIKDDADQPGADAGVSTTPAPGKTPTKTTGQHTVIQFASTSPKAKEFLDRLRRIQDVPAERAIGLLTELSKEARELADNEPAGATQIFLRSVSTSTTEDPERAREILVGLPQRVRNLPSAARPR